MIGKLKNLVKKEKEVEQITPDVPNLMEADPVTSGDDGGVNLMASDPVNSVPMEIPQEKKPEIVEQKGLEEQLAAPTPNEIPKEQEDEQSVIQTQTTTLDAFSMSAPVPEAAKPMSVEPEIETLDLSDANIERTQKICGCGTPNDPLAKFCVSCGQTYK